MSAAWSYVQNFFEKYLTIPDIYFSDVFEIAIIAILFYYIFLWFRKSRAWSLLKGILVIVFFMVFASLFHLTTLLWIINKTLSAGIIAIVIIFQPELRRALEQLGKKNVLFKFFKIGSNTEMCIRDSSYPANKCKVGFKRYIILKNGYIIIFTYTK